jgi:predicted nucleic acid-binding protein
MSFLLDHDTCAAYLRNRQAVINRCVQHRGNLHVCALTIMTVELWLSRYTTPSKLHNLYGALMRDVAIVSVDDTIAHQAARLGTRLRSTRPRIPTVPLVVAATAQLRNGTLVTHSPQTYAGIPNLTLADWFVP